VVGVLRSIILEAALVGVVVGSASAQVPTTYGELGVPRGGVRLKDVEESLPPPAAGDTRFARAYRFNTTSEMMFGHMRGVLGGTRDLDVEQDSSTLEPGETTPVSYRLDFHVFDDMCRDSGVPTTDTASCKSLLRGDTKRKAFIRSGRIPYPAASGEDVWIDRATFTWIVRNPDGAFVRWDVVVADDGLAKDWRHHEPYSRIVVTQTTHSKVAATAQAPPPAPAPAPAPPPAVVAPAHDPDLVPAPTQEPTSADQPGPGQIPPAEDDSMGGAIAPPR
jgi:hypothetical protein